MIANTQRGWRAADPLAIWRLGFAVTLVAQLFVLRLVSYGRFALLSGDGEVVSALWYLHTLTKVTMLGAVALLIAALVERRFSQPGLLARGWIWRISILHGGALIALLILLQKLPRGSQASIIAEGELWRFAATSGAFLAWQLTAVLLIGPRMLIRGLHLRAVVFLFFAITAAALLSTGISSIVSALRFIIEDSTLSLAVFFYGLIGTVEPVLSLSEGTPLLSGAGFAIWIGAPCAGYQGMLASATLMAGLIILEWPNLRRRRSLLLGLAAVVGVFVLNALRIALLFHIGVSYSPEIALDGFHSYFGILSLLAVVGAAMLTMQHRSFRRTNPDNNTVAKLAAANDHISWETEASILLLPLAIYLGLGMVLGLFNAGFNWTYPLLATAGLGFLALWRDHIRREFSGGLSFAGIAMGIAIYFMWMVMVPADPKVDATVAVELHSVPLSLMIGWMIFRLIGFSIVVPILEELAFRGGLQRLIDGKLAQFTGERVAALIAFALSSLAFGYMHADALAGTMAGAGFGLLVLRNGRVGDAIVAHAVTNFLLAITAVVTGHWSLW